MQVRLAKEARDHADIAVQVEPGHDLAHHMVGRRAALCLRKQAVEQPRGRPGRLCGLQPSLQLPCSRKVLTCSWLGKGA